jgi:site-specific DNA-adenine methylase
MDPPYYSEFMKYKKANTLISRDDDSSLSMVVDKLEKITVISIGTYIND